MPRQRVVLSGGPGSGKTTLLLEMQRRGHGIATDSARGIIRARLRRGSTPRPSPRRFAEEILRADIRQYRAHASAPGLVFFERGIVDALGMLSELDAVSDGELRSHLAAYPYHRQAFVLPPWEEIYVNDAERDQTFAEAERVFHAVRAWYRRCGYEVVDVPKCGVAERCEHVLRALLAANLPPPG